jgi:hypothetical protein
MDPRSQAIVILAALAATAILSWLNWRRRRLAAKPPAGMRLGLAAAAAGYEPAAPAPAAG